MGIGITIEKYRETDNSYFYKLYSIDRQDVVLYMKIEPLKNIILYSTCSNFSHIDNRIDLSDENALIGNIEGVDHIILSRSCLRAIKAIRENHFPKFISYYS